MYKSLLATSVGCALLLGSTLSAAAGESTFEMHAIRAKGPGPVIGTVHVTDSSEGAVLQLDLNELPPGPNRLFLHDAGDCGLPRDQLLSNLVTMVNVDISEDGAEPLKKTVVVPGMDVAGMSGKALVIHRGSQAADAAPEQAGAPRLVACGVIK